MVDQWLCSAQRIRGCAYSSCSTQCRRTRQVRSATSARIGESVYSGLNNMDGNVLLGEIAANLGGVQRCSEHTIPAISNDDIVRFDLFENPFACGSLSEWYSECADRIISEFFFNNTEPGSLDNKSFGILANTAELHLHAETGESRVLVAASRVEEDSARKYRWDYCLNVACEFEITIDPLGLVLFGSASAKIFFNAERFSGSLAYEVAVILRKYCEHSPHHFAFGGVEVDSLSDEVGSDVLAQPDFNLLTERLNRSEPTVDRVEQDMITRLENAAQCISCRSGCERHAPCGFGAVEKVTCRVSLWIALATQGLCGEYTMVIVEARLILTVFR